MNHYSSNREIRNRAKYYLQGYYGTAIFMCIISSILPSLLRTLLEDFIAPLIPSVKTAEIFSPSDLIPAFTVSLLLSLLLSTLFGVFHMGIALTFLNISCGNRVLTQDLFYGFMNDFSKTLSVSFVRCTINTVCLLPAQFFNLCFSFSGNSTYLTYAAISGIIGICIYLPLALNFELSYYLMLDFPELTTSEILKKSCQLMNGQKMRLFKLEFSMLPLYILGVLSFFVGFIWLVPFTHMCMACFYLDMMNPGKSYEADEYSSQSPFSKEVDTDRHEDNYFEW